MPAYEYKVVPAPARSVRVRGVRDPEDRYAVTLTRLMNEMAAEGWEFQRSEALPAEERRGLRGRAQVTRHVLIFRRALEESTEAPEATPESPEDFAARAAESLRAEPARVRPRPGAAPALGPARPARRGPRDLAAE